MKIRSAGAELFHANRWMDRWTDRHNKRYAIFFIIGNALHVSGGETARNM